MAPPTLFGLVYRYAITSITIATHILWRIRSSIDFRRQTTFKLSCHNRNLNFRGEIADMGCITFFEPPTVAFDNEAMEKFL
jgi:hypothetical protein